MKDLIVLGVYGLLVFSQRETPTVLKASNTLNKKTLATSKSQRMSASICALLTAGELETSVEQVGIL